MFYQICLLLLPAPASTSPPSDLVLILTPPISTLPQIHRPLRPVRTAAPLPASRSLPRGSGTATRAPLPAHETPPGPAYSTGPAPAPPRLHGARRVPGPSPAGTVRTGAGLSAARGYEAGSWGVQRACGAAPPRLRTRHWRTVPAWAAQTPRLLTGEATQRGAEIRPLTAPR